MDISKFLTQILSTTWFFQAHKLVAYGAFIKELVEGNIDREETKPALAAYAITPTGKKLMLFNENTTDSLEDKPESMFDQFPEGTILIVPIKGVLFKETTWWSYGTEFLAEIIRQAADHNNISAVILDTDSGGGSVDAIFPMVDVINYAKTKMPVIGWADMAASAAYYSLAPTDLIIASNDISSEFGSIGVMISFADIRPYWEEMGIKFHTIYASESDHKNLPFENALKGDYKLMKELVLTPLAKKFQADVRSFRKGKVDITQKGILNGKMFYANDAIKYGLADELGNLDYAIKRAHELASKRK